MSTNTNPEPQEIVSIRIPDQNVTQINLPCGDLLEGSRKTYIDVGVRLYEASIKGDWKAAKSIFRIDPTLIRFAITESYETPLHIAASTINSKQVEAFVKKLVREMEVQDLELRNKDYNTALSLAAAAGNVNTAKIMVKKNPDLLEIPGNYGLMPLYIAASLGKHDMVRFLYEKSSNMSRRPWTNMQRGWVLRECITNDIFDVALKIANDCPQLLTDNGLLYEVLLALAPKTEAFQGVKLHIIWRIIKSFIGLLYWETRPTETDCEALKLLEIFWKKISIMPKEQIDKIIKGPATITSNNGADATTVTSTEGTVTTEKFKSTLLFVAAKRGNARFIIELIRSYPDLIWWVDDSQRTMFHIAIKRRHESIYNILHEIGPSKGYVTALEDMDGNNMLHLLGKGATKIKKPDLPGVALQMQRELLWYKEVAQMIPPAFREKKNRKGKTPYDLFKETHLEHVAQGEKWMKETASQCMVVAALIATIVFGAAFIIPGGYAQTTGDPSSNNVGFMVFVISDAASLIFSSTSVLMFVSILTSIYAEKTFLESLPKKLMFGLATLFLSLLTMMISFSASFFSLYHKKLIWLPIVVTGLASMPVFIFATLQFPFLVNVFYSTYRSTYLFQQKTRKLYT